MNLLLADKIQSKKVLIGSGLVRLKPLRTRRAVFLRYGAGNRSQIRLGSAPAAFTGDGD